MSRRSQRLEKVPSITYTEKHVKPLPKHERPSKKSKMEQTPIPEGWKIGPMEPKSEIVGTEVMVFWPEEGKDMGYYHALVLEYEVSDGKQPCVIPKGHPYHTVYYTDPKWEHMTEYVESSDLNVTRRYLVKENKSEKEDNNDRWVHKFIIVERSPGKRKEMVDKELNSARGLAARRRVRNKIFKAFVIRRDDPECDDEDGTDRDEDDAVTYTIMFLFDHYHLSTGLDDAKLYSDYS